MFHQLFLFGKIFLLKGPGRAFLAGTSGMETCSADGARVIVI